MQLAIHAKIRIIFPYIVEFLLKNSDELLGQKTGEPKPHQTKFLMLGAYIHKIRGTYL